MEITKKALRTAVKAMAMRTPESPYPDGNKHILACPCCGSGEYLHNEDGNKNLFCGQCGKAIKWDGECWYE